MHPLVDLALHETPLARPRPRSQDYGRGLRRFAGKFQKRWGLHWQRLGRPDELQNFLWLLIYSFVVR